MPEPGEIMHRLCLGPHSDPEWRERPHCQRCLKAWPCWFATKDARDHVRTAAPEDYSATVLAICFVGLLIICALAALVR